MSVVADDRRSLAVFDFHIDSSGHRVIRVSDRQILAANRRPAARLHNWRANERRWLVAIQLGQLQALQLFRFVAGLRGCICVGAVLVDESLQLLLFGDDSRICPFVPNALFLDGLQIRIDLTRIHGQFSACQIERVATGRIQKCPVVGDDQAGFPVVTQEMLQQNLGAQVEEVRRFVEQQQVWFVQQQCGQFDASLPASRQLAEGTAEVRSFEFELARDLTALPVWLLTIPHQKFQSRLARQKRVVLPQISQFQSRMPDDLAAIELFLVQQNLEQGGFSGAVASDEADFHVFNERRFCPVQQGLIAETLVSVSNLQQHSHTSTRPRNRQ